MVCPERFELPAFWFVAWAKGHHRGHEAPLGGSPEGAGTLIKRSAGFGTAALRDGWATKGSAIWPKRP
jgi:hypothetical protein